MAEGVKANMFSLSSRPRLFLLCPSSSNPVVFLRPAEEEDHKHLGRGEEVPAQVHHRSKGQHSAGDPGGHRGVGGDASAGLRLRDHHPQRGAGQAGTGTHTGLCQGEEQKKLIVVLMPLFIF